MFTAEQIEVLRSEYGKITKVDPDSPIVENLRKAVAEMPRYMRQQLADIAPPVPWITYFAEQTFKA